MPSRVPRRGRGKLTWALATTVLLASAPAMRADREAESPPSRRVGSQPHDRPPSWTGDRGLPLARLKRLLWGVGDDRAQPERERARWVAGKVVLDTYLAEEAEEFSALDADRDEHLTPAEHAKLALDLTADGDASPEELFALRDVDPRDGLVSRSEWLDFARRNHGYPEQSVHRAGRGRQGDDSTDRRTEKEQEEHETQVRNEFSAADADGDGYLSVEEAAKMILADNTGKDQLAERERNSVSFKKRAAGLHPVSRVAKVAASASK